MVYKPIRCSTIFAIFAGLFIILTLVLVILAIVVAGDQDSLQRFCIEAIPTRVVPGPVSGSEALNGLLFGKFELRTNKQEIAYDFRYVGLSTIVAIHVRGPIQGNTNVGNIKFALCGSPSSTVCDLSIQGTVGGVLGQILPGATSPTPEILNIRKEPWLYYVEVLTNNNPVTPGALRGPLFSTCGSP